MVKNGDNRPMIIKTKRKNRSNKSNEIFLDRNDFKQNNKTQHNTTLVFSVAEKNFSLLYKIQ